MSEGPAGQDGFKKSKLLCWAILLISGIAYGSSFSWMKVAITEGANPLGMVLWFATIATVVLAVLIMVRGQFTRIRPRYLWFCVPWGILSVIVPNIFFFIAAGEIQASLIALGIALVPILTLTGAVALRRDALTAGRSAGIGLGALGIGLILLPEASLPDIDDTLFVIIAFLGAACYAAEHLFIEIKIPDGVEIDLLLFLMFLSSAVLMAPFVWMSGTFIVPSWPLGAMELAILAVALITLADYFFITLLILLAGPVFTSQAAYIVTLAGVAWGIVIFGDTHSIWVWTAAACLMIGLFLVRPRARES